MRPKILLPYAAMGLLFVTCPAWAAMTNAQAKALSETAYRHPGSKMGAAALHDLESAANAGVSVAQDWLGLFYNTSGGFAKANYWFEKAAEQGDADAQLNLGNAYLNGQGVPKSNAKANYWFTKAAEQGEAVAQNNLGVLYFSGQGVPRSYAKANYWYKKAAEQGYAVAQNNLGISYFTGHGVPKSNAKANYWYTKAAEQGEADAENNLGVAYSNGQGVPKSNAKANYWFTKAAEQGYADGQYNLGYAYSNGQGVPKSYAKANYWYTKAAEQGEADAENNLGVAYQYGQGVPKNNAKAAYWYKKAAAQGILLAKNNLVKLAVQEKLIREQANSPLKLFGVGLKGASRADLEPALAKSGLTPHHGHVGSKWYWDEYDVNGQLSGASDLDVGYTQNSHFAMAEYTFPSSMDIGQVRHIVRMVSTKYGQPSSVNGDYRLGPVTAVWNVGDGMEVEVRRGWPNTTTYLDLIDVGARARMKRQLAMQSRQRQMQMAKAQSNAY